MLRNMLMFSKYATGEGYAYFLSKSTRKFLFLKVRGLSTQRLNHLSSLNRVLLGVGVCSRRRLQNFCSLILNVNSSSLKLWFTELSLVGLGFRFSVKDVGTSFRLNVGYSHAVLVPILTDLFLLKRKKRCLVVSSSLVNLRSFVTQTLRLKKNNVYKLKGLQLKGLVFKLKPGKRSK